VTQTVEPKNKALLLDAMKRFMHALDLYAAAIATALLAVAVVSSRVGEAVRQSTSARAISVALSLDRPDPRPAFG
jgi:hypothetical protein